MESVRYDVQSFVSKKEAQLEKMLIESEARSDLCEENDDESKVSVTTAYSTIGNLPAFATQSVCALFDTLLKPFEKYHHGVIIHGPLDDTRPLISSWGRRVVLPGGEVVQVRFSPQSLLDFDFDETATGIALISFRFTHGLASHVRTAVLFPSETDVPLTVDPWKRSCSRLAPRGQHLLMLSFFKQYFPRDALRNKLSSASWSMDPLGFGSVRSTTFSVSTDAARISAATTNPGSPTRPKKLRALQEKMREKMDSAEGDDSASLVSSRLAPATAPRTLFDHVNSTFVAPGTSVLQTAAELVNIHMPDASRRACEPIHPKDFDELMSRARENICSGDQNAGRAAIATSVAVTELLSGEGILNMTSNEFFSGALPTALVAPSGLGLLIAMSVRLAMDPSKYSLGKGNVTDQIASADLKTLFESQLAPLPMIEARTWALDVAIKMAQRNTQPGRVNPAKPESYEPSASNAQRLTHAGSVKNKDIAVLTNDQLHYWHRTGQAIVSALFSPGMSLDSWPSTRFGKPTRFFCPLLAARDTASIEMGVNAGNVRDAPRVNLASVGVRRSRLICMLVETEKYLRTGVYRGVQEMPTNDEAKVDAQMWANHAVLNELIMPSVKKQFASFDLGAHRKMQTELYKSYCMSAMSQAVTDMTEALTAGPVVSFKHQVGAFLVAESQAVFCCECGARVHVLSVMLQYTDSVTESGRRCFGCAKSLGGLDAGDAAPHSRPQSPA